jgi:hypothetical protein
VKFQKSEKKTKKTRNFALFRLILEISALLPVNIEKCPLLIPGEKIGRIGFTVGNADPKNLSRVFPSEIPSILGIWSKEKRKFSKRFKSVARTSLSLCGIRTKSAAKKWSI